MVVTLDDTIVHQPRDQGVGEAVDQRRGFATGRSMIVGSAPPTNGWIPALVRIAEKAAQGKGSRRLDPFGQTPSLQPG
jgi:hypothetical protein